MEFPAQSSPMFKPFPDHLPKFEISSLFDDQSRTTQIFRSSSSFDVPDKELIDTLLSFRGSDSLFDSLKDSLGPDTPVLEKVSSPIGSPSLRNPLRNSSAMVDLSPYLHLPQTEAAKKLGLTSSNLSKKWRETSKNRKWPSRTIIKLEKKLSILLQNIPSGQQPSQEVQLEILNLIKEKKSLLEPMFIRA